MNRQEDFIEAGIAYRFEHGKPMAIGGDNFADVERDFNRVISFEAGAEYGYQYALQHPQWIPVEKELPKEENAYLVSDGDGVLYGYFIEGRWAPTELNETCTHWMQLPAAPVTHWMEIVPPRKEEDDNE